MAVFDNLQALIDLLGDSPDVAELTLSRPGGEQITLKRPIRSAPALPMRALGDSVSAAPPPSSSGQAVEPHTATAASSVPAATTELLANRVGIYHPAKPPLELGGQVASGQIVGYIEAIKLMNEVRATSEGTVAGQFVEDGMPVEYGQPLFQLSAQ